MSLFVEYQIPSDLLSFEGSPDTNITRKVESVKGYVKAVMMDVMDSAKEKQLEDEKRKAKMREQMNDVPSSTSPSSSPSASPSAESSRSRRLSSSAGQAQQTLQYGAKIMMSAQAGTVDDRFLLDVSESSSTDSSSQQSIRTSEPVGSSTKSEDFTLIPKMLDAKLEQYDTEGTLKSTIVKADQN